MVQAACVGALIRDDQNRGFVHRRGPGRRLFPGTWDVVGGHVEPGESPHEALAREIEEETGWGLRRIEAMVADWTWETDGKVRHELDYLVEVEGDLSAPRRESGKHDAFAWVGPDDLDLLMEGRADGDRQLHDIVAKATRIRLTERLRLEPLGLEHLEDLLALHRDPGVAAWFDGPWSEAEAQKRTVRAADAWENVGAGRWMAYERSTGDLVGRGGVALTHVDGADRFEVGWVVRESQWGQGYATEMGRAELAFAFDHLGADEVVAFTEPHNERSRAVMSRLLMQFSKEIRHADRPMVLYIRPDAGHADALHEQLDGATGDEGSAPLHGRDATFWENHRAQVERASRSQEV